MSDRRRGSETGGGWLRGLLLGLIPDPRDREEIATDLEELRRRRRTTVGPLRAALGYWWEIFRAAWTLRHGRSGSAARVHGRSSDGAFVALGHLADTVGHDLRHSLRGFIRRPGLPLVAVPTMALAVGAMAAVFAFADALVLRPLAVPDPDRLVALWHVAAEDGTNYSEFSYPDYLDLLERSAQMDGVAAYSSIGVRMGIGVDAEPMEGQIVSGNFFAVLGVKPLLGRGFLPEEDRTPDTHPVVVIGQNLWERRFAGDAGVIGADIVLAGRPFTVIGVAPRSAPSGDLQLVPDFWVPLMMHPTVLPGFQAFGTQLFGNRGTHWLKLVGRLADGASHESARAELRSIALVQAEEHPETNGGWTISVSRAGDPREGPPSARRLVGLTALLGAVVVMVLLIACANVANLLLARASERHQEMGIRSAIGAGRGRLARQVLTEALALALIGGGAGLVLAYWLMGLLPYFGLADALAGLDVRLDGRVLAFGVGLSVLTGAVFGLVPALQASAVRAAWGGRGLSADATGGRGGLPMRPTLVVIQVALSVVLLVGAGLTLRTLRNLTSVPLGFDPERVRVAWLDFSETGTDSPLTRVEIQRQVLERVRSLPGVEAASVAMISLFSGSRMANDILWESGDPGGPRSRTNVDMNVVGVGYFRTLGIPVLRGRPFNEDDGQGSVDVAVVNQALADRLWPGQNPLGKRFWSWRPNGPDAPLEVVGVVGNGRYYRSWKTADRPFAFLPEAQQSMRWAALHVRGVGPSTPTGEAIRRAILEVDPAIPPPRAQLVSAARSRAVAVQRTTARLVSLFGFLATAIAAIGIYGVVSFMVARRTHDIGVRIALGARPGDVLRFVLLGSAGPILVGTVLGCLIALGLGPLVAGLLFGVGPRDPLTFGLVAVGLAAVAMFASWAPARRATAVSPLEALRE